jgi:hypothetical protein
MRFVGAALLVGAASTFMLQHWTHGGSAQRYLYLLCHTALLAFAGALCGLKVRESRAARTFFGLVLASAPVHFAVLGGMLRSVLPLDASAGPNDMWPMHSVASALALLAVGLCVVIPLLRLAAATLARPCAPELTRAYLAMNAFVLLPVREPLIVALLACGMLALGLVLDGRISRLGYVARTGEARFARALVGLPNAIVIGRAVLWYDPTLFAYGLFMSCTGLALFFTAPRMLREHTAILQPACAIVAGVGATLMAHGVASHAHLPEGLSLPLYALPSAAIGLGLSWFAESDAGLYRRAAALIAGSTLSINVLDAWGFGLHIAAAWVALPVGLALVITGAIVGHRTLLLSGAVPAVLGLVRIAIALIAFESLRGWAALSVLGAALIFGAALIERHGDRLAAWARALQSRVTDW